MSSEFERIAQLSALFARPSASVAIGIGDDCAVLRPPAVPEVWTIDAAVAGVHFDLALMPLPDVAYRAFMAAASDVAAMGGRAVAALSALVLPSDFSDEQLAQLGGGLARAADACDCAIVGGNLARGALLSLTTSVLGACAERVITRDGARAGDGVFVTGTLGGAALGLLALQRGLGDDARFVPSVARFLAPRARLDLAATLSRVATAAIDVSDGLLQDLSHVCRASGVGARIERDALPLLPGFSEAASALGLDGHALALGGGEDYELLFTAPESSVPSALATRIGTVTDTHDTVLVLDAHGVPIEVRGGFDHFAPR